MGRHFRNETIANTRDSASRTPPHRGEGCGDTLSGRMILEKGSCEVRHTNFELGALDSGSRVRQCPATMKKTRLLLFSLFLLSGCAHQYVMTLNNGVKLNAASKPKLKQGKYYYKDAQG